jgi:hypothetical protein
VAYRRQRGRVYKEALVADQNKLDEILGRAIREPEFRERLTKDPDAVAEEVGLESSEVELFGAALAIGSKFGDTDAAWCTGKTCNETGGARMPISFWNPAQKIDPPQ